METTRTDLALESADSLCQGGRQFSAESGLVRIEGCREGYRVTQVTVTSPAGAEAIGKPIGRYVTVDLRDYFQRSRHFFQRAVRCLAAELKELLPPKRGAGVLVAGLGNRGMTADAVGPLALESLLVTRHMVRDLPEQFNGFTPVSALATGVLAATGMETLEIIRGAAAAVEPAAIIAIDALAARSRDRLCATVQLSDTGLVPGSGVGNHRRGVDKAALGVPVIALGVPTVIAQEDLCGGDGAKNETLFLTVQDIDSRVRELSRLIGYGITLALQPSLGVDDITGLLG